MSVEDETNNSGIRGDYERRFEAFYMGSRFDRNNSGGDKKGDGHSENSNDGDGKGKKQKKEDGVTKEQIEQINSVLEKADYAELAFEYLEKFSAPKGYNDNTLGLLTVKTGKGSFTRVITQGSYLNLEKTVGAAAKFYGYIGYGATIVETGLNVYEYSHNEISGRRLSYRLTGSALALATPIIYGAAVGSEAGPLGTVLGIGVGVTFGVTEQFYDQVAKPMYNTLTNGLGNIEKGLGSGTWHP